MAEEKKKNLLDMAVDALTNRDEKAAAQKAQLDLMAEKEARARAEMDAKKAKEEADKVKAEAEQAKIKAQQEAEQAKYKAQADAEIKAREDERRLAMQAAAQAAEAKAKAEAAVIKHVWTKEDTYADLAQRFYGSFKEPYWRLIYEYNKEIIGNHPNAIRVGLEIKIPPLPEELKIKK